MKAPKKYERFKMESSERIDSQKALNPWLSSLAIASFLIALMLFLPCLAFSGNRENIRSDRVNSKNPRPREIRPDRIRPSRTNSKSISHSRIKKRRLKSKSLKFKKNRTQKIRSKSVRGKSIRRGKSRNRSLNQNRNRIRVVRGKTKNNQVSVSPYYNPFGLEPEFYIPNPASELQPFRHLPTKKTKSPKSDKDFVYYVPGKITAARQ